MIALETTSTSGLVAIDTNPETLYSDYSVFGTTLVALNSTSNNRFLLNCLISDQFYSSYYSLLRPITSKSAITITAAYAVTGVTLTRYIIPGKNSR